jgi:hypothetical protein
MKPFRLGACTLAATLALLAPRPLAANFHLMQIEQVVGGVCGDPSAQAIQLRMRTAFQGQVAGADLVAHDAAGDDPVTLLTFPSNVANSAAGSRILVTTSGFMQQAGGPAADFTLTAPIPISYLAAGKLTFGDFGLVYWSLAWGGASYTGSNSGQTDNDTDGDFNPPFPDPLPTSGDRSVLFGGSASAKSTNNAADYALSASPATLTNNAGVAAPLFQCLFGDGFESGDTASWSAVVPAP